MIYLDSAATSLLKPPEVAQAVAESFSRLGNAGRGGHEPTLQASRLLYDTREKLAALLDAEGAETIAFAANVTEALNIAIGGLVTPGVHAITTVCEHNSVLRPLYRAEKMGAELTVLPADEKGRVDLKDLEGAFRPNTGAVVLAHASNLTGNTVDLRAAAEIAHRHGALLVVDAAQTAGSVPISVRKTGVDILCFTGHKSLLGPQGTGGLYLRPGLSLPPLKVGGSGFHSFDREHPAAMPEGLEAGTLNGHGLAGLNAALDYLLRVGVESIHEKETGLARQFAEEVGGLPGVTLYGDYDALCRAPIVTLNIGNMDSAVAADILWEDYGICVRAGAHCAPLMHRHFGTAEQGAVRFSFSCFNTPAEVETAARAVRELSEEEMP